MRFDPVYVGPFKSNVCRLIDYPNLWGYTRDLYQWPGVRETVDFRHIRDDETNRTINPTRIVPGGPIFASMTRMVENRSNTSPPS